MSRDVMGPAQITFLTIMGCVTILLITLACCHWRKHIKKNKRNVQTLKQMEGAVFNINESKYNLRNTGKSWQIARPTYSLYSEKKYTDNTRRSCQIAGTTYSVYGDKEYAENTQRFYQKAGTTYSSYGHKEDTKQYRETSNTGRTCQMAGTSYSYYGDKEYIGDNTRRSCQVAGTTYRLQGHTKDSTFHQSPALYSVKLEPSFFTYNTLKVETPIAGQTSNMSGLETLPSYEELEFILK